MIDPTIRQSSDRDSFWMRCAIAEAWRGEGSVEPNPMVGAVLVRDDRLLCLGHHQRFGGPHAEVEAICRAGESARGATLYVTLEPCRHHGKTPPCTQAVIEAGITRVVASQQDPFPKVSGGGFAQLREAGIAVTVGVEHEGARRLNAPYLKRLHTGRPYVTAKWAMTLDGKIATSTGDSQWISSITSRARVHELRGKMDGILIGIGTALADDPLLTARPRGPRVPVRVILDPLGSLPTNSVLVKTSHDVPVWVVVNDRASVTNWERLESHGCEVIYVPGSERIPIEPLLDELGTRGLTNLLVEGGGRVLGSFFNVREVDAVDAYIAPIIEGGSHNFGPFRGQGHALMAEASRLEHVQLEQLEGDLRIRGTLPASWRLLA